MKNYTIIIITLLALLSCSKQEIQKEEVPAEEPSIPEKVETAFTKIVEKPWAELSDTLSYYYENVLSKGMVRGMGPDGVYYGLEKVRTAPGTIKEGFYVKDSLFVSLAADLIDDEIEISAFNTDIYLNKAEADSTDISVDSLMVRCPVLFFADTTKTASLFYAGAKVGWLTRNKFENIDYENEMRLVVHYYDDPRTFAFNAILDIDTAEWFIPSL